MQAMANCKTLTSVHLRRAGMWFDTLASLIPPVVCPQIKVSQSRCSRLSHSVKSHYYSLIMVVRFLLQNLKLDSNSLAYLSSGYFNDAMDTLLSRVPNLETLHLGNNQLDGTQAMSLANSIVRHKIDKLETLTLGSNNIGDRALAAILKALPPTMKQLYLHGMCKGHMLRVDFSSRITAARLHFYYEQSSHCLLPSFSGCDIHNEGLKTLGAALDRMPHLWGLGLVSTRACISSLCLFCRVFLPMLHSLIHCDTYCRMETRSQTKAC